MSLRTFKFEEGLAPGDWLEILTQDPLFAMLGRALPAYGDTTRPSNASSAAVLLTGAATVVFPSDRKADAHLRRYWDVEREAWGVEMLPEKPVLSHVWRYYRDTYLTEAVVAEMWDLFRDGAACYARDIGLFPDGPADFRNPDPNRAVFADGSVWGPASKVGWGTGDDIHPSRSKAGNPRYVDDLTQQGKMIGYPHVVVFGQLFDPTTGRAVPRTRLILDAARVRVSDGGSKGGEMVEVIPACQRLRDRLGDGPIYLVYDGALRGVHARQLGEMGMVAVSKPHGIRHRSQLENYDDKKVAAAKLFTVNIDGCTHQLAAAVEHLWDTVFSHGSHRYTDPLPVIDVRRTFTGQGYQFEADFHVPCDTTGGHVLTVPHVKGATIPGSRKQVPAELALIPMADAEVFGRVYGRRNGAESGFNQLKNQRGMGPRAQSYTGLRHEIDLLLACVLNNALVRAEHRQTSLGRKAA